MLQSPVLAASAQIGLISPSMVSAPSAMDRISLSATPTFHHADLQIEMIEPNGHNEGERVCGHVVKWPIY